MFRHSAFAVIWNEMVVWIHVNSWVNLMTNLWSVTWGSRYNRFRFFLDEMFLSTGAQMGRLALMNFIHSLNTPLLVRSRGIHLNGHQVCKGSVVLTCLVIQCAAFWSVGPLQHGATVLAAAGQRWSYGEKHDGGVSTITQTLSAGKPTQACRNHSLYTCRHAGLLVSSETERSSAIQSLYVLLAVVTRFIDWNSDWWGDPGDHEEMLGGKPVCPVSSHSCSRMASLPLSSQPRAQQVRQSPFIYWATHTQDVVTVRHEVNSAYTQWKVGHNSNALYVFYYAQR